MTQRFSEVDGLEEQLGITFGLGIDLDTTAEAFRLSGFQAFRLYAVFGGLEEDPEGSPSDASTDRH